MPSICTGRPRRFSIRADAAGHLVAIPAHERRMESRWTAPALEYVHDHRLVWPSTVSIGVALVGNSRELGDRAVRIHAASTGESHRKPRVEHVSAEGHAG